MILDDVAATNIAQGSADRDNVEYQIYRRKTGEYLICAKGSIGLLKQVIPASEQVQYIKSVKPSVGNK